MGDLIFNLYWILNRPNATHLATNGKYSSNNAKYSFTHCFRDSARCFSGIPAKMSQGIVPQIFPKKNYNYLQRFSQSFWSFFKDPCRNLSGHYQEVSLENIFEYLSKIPLGLFSFGNLYNFNNVIKEFLEIIPKIFYKTIRNFWNNSWILSQGQN